jgi:GNAT superfamily N-acetyltransferase
MIYEVEPQGYSRVRELFAQLSEYNMSVVVALEHNYPCRVFVNDLESPTSGFIYLGRMTFGFSGSSDNENFNSQIKELITNELIPFIRTEHKVKELIIRFDTEWKNKINTLLDNLVEHQLGNFLFRNLNYDYRKHSLPEGYTYATVDSDFLKMNHLKDFDVVDKWVKGCYLSTEDYLSRGFGFSIIHDEEEVASTCMCNYISRDRKRCEIGIITAEEHRKRGLAKNLVSYIVSHCLKLDIQRIDWQSRLSNIGSIKTAEAVGFELDKKYSGYVSQIG